MSETTLFKGHVKTPLGTLVLGFNEQELFYCLWDFEESAFPELQRSQLVKKNPVLELAKQQIQEYFSNQRKNFELPIKLKGTTFQMKAWNVLNKIPYGETWSYTKQAQALRSQAVRAVGSANAKNPICLILPCHRVTRSDGSLGGYAGGIKIKEKLLLFEKGQLQF